MKTSIASDLDTNACTPEEQVPVSLELSVAPKTAQRNREVDSEVGEVILDHHIFDSHNGWRRAESMWHPTLNLQLSTDPSDYAHLNIPCPKIELTDVTTVTDTGAQSCLWGFLEFHRCGLKDSDLRPVRRAIRAANREIIIAGAIFLRLTGTAEDSTIHTARLMV